MKTHYSKVLLLIAFLLAGFTPELNAQESLITKDNYKVISLKDHSLELSPLLHLNNKDSQFKTGSKDWTVIESAKMQVPLSNPDSFISFTTEIKGPDVLQLPSKLFIKKWSKDLRWSDWESIEFNHHDINAKDHHLDAKKISELYFLQEVDSIQIKVMIQSEIPAQIEDISLHFFKPASLKKDNTPTLKNNNCNKPNVISRTNWGCPQGQNSPNWTPTYTDVTHLIIHHSANNLNNPPYNWSNVVQAIWNYHTFNKNWGDIGYQYLIAPDGTIYEGRNGGDNVVGAHAYGANQGTMGVCLIGDFQNNTPSNLAKESLVELLSWKADQENIDPLGTSTLTSNGLEDNITGHKEVGLTPTSCPGAALFNDLANLRNEVNAYLATYCGPEIPTIAPTLFSPNNGASGQSINEITFNWGMVEYADQYRLQVATSNSNWTAENGFDAQHIIYNQNIGGTTSLNLQGLSECTTYYWTVRGGNINGGSPFAIPFSFTTNGCETICESPTIDGYPFAYSCGTGYLYWTHISDANSYNLYYWNNGWQYFHNTSNTSISLNLPSNSTYYFAVRAVCGTNNISSINNYVSITTPACKTDDNETGLSLQFPQSDSVPNEQISEITNTSSDLNLDLTQNASSNSINIYPNPSQGSTTFTYSLSKQSPVIISLFDSNGKIVKEIANQIKDSGKHIENLELFDLPNGVYFVQIKLGEKFIRKKMVLLKDN